MAKPKTKSNQNQEEKVEKVVTTVVETPEEKPKRVRKEIDRNMLVEVISNVTGEFFYSNRSGTVQFELADFGDATDLTFAELQEMKTSQSIILKDGWLVIEDEDVIDLFGLTEMYKYIVKPYELDAFLQESTDVIKTKIKNMPKGCKQTIAVKALEKFNSGELDSTKIMKAIEEALGYDLFKRN